MNQQIYKLMFLNRDMKKKKKPIKKTTKKSKKKSVKKPKIKWWGRSYEY